MKHSIKPADIDVIAGGYDANPARSLSLKSEAARKRAYETVKNIQFQGAHYRDDIGV